MTESEVFVVIPVFNRIQYTKKCLSSLNNQTYKKVSVILVDSGSTDGTREYFLKNYPEWKLIKGNPDWWWSRCMYEGVEHARKRAKMYDFILEMNNDCYFNNNYISQLINTSKKYPNAIIGSICVRHNRPSVVVESGIRIHWPTGIVYSVADKISKKLSYYKNMEVVTDLDALPGKGTLVPMKIIQDIGNFRYRLLPHYIADYEFANRAKRNGYELLVDTKAIVKHYWDATGISSKNFENDHTYKQAWKLLFGRKSMNNIVDWIVFLFLACPKKYLLNNLFITFTKIVKALFSVYPLRFFKPQATWILNKYMLFIKKLKK